MWSLGRFMLALSVAACAGVSDAAAQTTGPAPGAPPTVVELFTSQGCSSCPPSDRQLGELAKRPDVLPLSLHVDYWDYIGWKDPFASPANTERQRGYARVLKQRYVYTPEMVFGGIVHDPGSDPAKVGKMLRIAGERVGVKVSPVLTRTAGNGIAVVMLESRVTTPCDIWLVTFDRQHHTAVARGENKGAKLTNHNVVRSFEKLGTWNGQAATWKVAGERVSAGQSVAVLVQGVSYGPIIGAARLDRSN
jgi:hypothetical protein